jgi:hypothetical protein
MKFGSRARSRQSRPHPLQGRLRALVLGALVLTPLAATAADPSSGSLSPQVGAAVHWRGTLAGGVSPGPMLDDHDGFCEEGLSCETFKLTLTGEPEDWQGLTARIFLSWGTVATDYDFYVHQGAPDGPVVASGTTGPTTSEQDRLDPAEDGTGDFYVHVVYFAATAADPYEASAMTVAQKGQGFPPAPIDAGLPPRYQTHTPTAEQIAAGMSRNTQDEPNIGVNWKTGAVMFQNLLQTLRVRFDDEACPQTPASTWVDRSPVIAAQSFDPILFTDHETNRTFVSHLLLNPLSNPSAFTDDDGETWLPSQGAGVGSGIDHQTIGGGPFHAPLTTGIGYKNAVYYCAQDIAFANCALSLDGGLTYGPAVPMYDLTVCAGLHGHVKVGPDGTVYVPNGSCSGVENPLEQGVAVSEDNGTTWEVRTVPGSAAKGGSDPSVAADTAGRLYFGFVDNDENPAVAVSDDHGRTWAHVYDVGAMAGVRSATFPAMVAGGPGRAAMAFYGTTSGGSVNSFDSHAVWYLFVAHTYDGGASWITVNATPGDPLQRGGIHLGGGSSIHRNLLDFFDADLDAEGRMLVGYADGCVGDCVQAPDEARGNSYTAYGTIARQTGGRRLFEQLDPAEPTVPGAPRLNVSRNGAATSVAWSQTEDGGSPITAYHVHRRTLDGPEKLLATLPGTATRFEDGSADPLVAYAYRVSAVNALGQSCGTNEVVAAPRGSSCTAPGIRVVDDAKGDQRGAPLGPDMDVEWVAVGESVLDGGRKLVLTLKVASLAALPPDRMWRVLWLYPDAPQPPHPTSSSFTGRYYIGMNTDESGAVSFEYGIVRSLSAVVVDALPPTRLGAAEPESSFDPDGTIRLVIAAEKIGHPRAGDLIGGLVARTYAVRQDQTLRSDSAADSALGAAAYRLVDDAFCAAPPVTVDCLGDGDEQIAYGKGWHQVEAAEASDGRFRFTASKHGMSFTFSVPELSTGTVIYHHARSRQGGSADVYVDGVFRERLDFSDATGSLRQPRFGFSARYGDLEAGEHTFELRNVDGAVYVDGFCLESAISSGATPASGPGATTSRLQVLGAAASLLHSVNVTDTVQALSVVASTDGSPIRVVLLDPGGAALATAESVNGVAVLDRFVSKAGLYQVQIVNLALGSAEVWTAATPFGQR